MRDLATSRRSYFVMRAGQLATTVTLTIMIASGCGGVNSAGGDAAAGTWGLGGHGGDGAGGAAGSAGSTGAAGMGAAGTTGAGGSSAGGGGSNGGAAAAGRGGGGGAAGSSGGGSTGTGGSSGQAGGGGSGINCTNGSPCPGFCIPGQVYCNGICLIQCQGGGGTTGTAGTGGVAGRGGSGGSGGSAGSTGNGGAGGTTSPCQAVLALDRSCATAADCFAGAHTSNCCGQVQFIGFSNSVKAQFQTLETQCDATYPACGCAAQQPTADDGSRLRFTDQAGVSCLQGKCTTFVPDCGKPCGAGTTCFSCVSKPTNFAACTTTCADSNECRDPTLPLCQMGSSGNVAGKYCTANVGCDIR